MINKAADEMKIDLKRSYLVGDRETDIECGINAGIKTVLLKNTIEEDKINQLHRAGKSPNFIADKFTDACNYVIEDFSGGDS
jgi:D-glycero-D-manno-heptose 1,7-bisphosphate phosphatase